MMIRWTKHSLSHYQRCSSLISRTLSSITAHKVPGDSLSQLLDHLSDKPQETSNAMANTIKWVLSKQAQAEFYVDEWPPHQLSTIVARITSATVTDIVLYTSYESKSRALEVLQDVRILGSPGSYIHGGVIFEDIEPSLAKYLMDTMKSPNGKPLLKSMIETTMFQLPRGRINDLHKRETPSLPKGYSIGILKQGHGKLVRQHWNQVACACTRDTGQFEEMIKTLPTTAVYHKDNTEIPVGWMLTYPSGRFGNAYIQEGHRGYQLSRALAVDLCKKLVHEGIIPEITTKNEIIKKYGREEKWDEFTGYQRLYVDKAVDTKCD